jgi:hypothetical protein
MFICLVLLALELSYGVAEWHRRRYLYIQGKVLESKLLSTNSAIALLIRHYFAQGVREAHKVLGGTGPAIAQIPLTVLWAGGTMFDLTRDLATRRAGALSALPRVGFITLTAASQIIGVASKMAAALLAILPYERHGDLSDAATVARYVVRPANAIEAFSMATKAFFQVCHLWYVCSASYSWLPELLQI